MYRQLILKSDHPSAFPWLQGSSSIDTQGVYLYLYATVNRKVKLKMSECIGLKVNIEADRIFNRIGGWRGGGGSIIGIKSVM